MDNERLNLISIKKLVSSDTKYSFLIPSYQRGYRWTPKNVKALLKDLWEFMITPKEDKDFYCLQPVVVKKNGEHWELIDGQQRLTTIYILLKILKIYLPKSKPPFKIFYKTRTESEGFLRDLKEGIDEEEVNSNIDFCHIYNAYIAAKEWLEKKDDDELIYDFNKILLSKVKIIWYEVKDPDIKAKEVFTRINVGKIGLTNAELIKALFLQGDKWKTEKKDKEETDDKSNIFLNQIKIASAWDRIENYLREDDFWYFLTNKTNKDKYVFNRIEYIFDLMSQKGESIDDFFTFYWFSERFEEEGKKPDKLMEDIWEEIEVYFMTFREWFEDSKLYHKIGYLINSGMKLQSIKESFKDKT